MIRDWISFGEHLTIGVVLLRVLVAIVLSSLIGIDREKKNRPAGLRTHMLVCLGALLIAMIEQEAVAEIAVLASSHINVSVGRLTGAVVSGVGFLGAGTIIMSHHNVYGLTTAASIWCTACIGVSIGFGFMPIAIIGGILVLLILNIAQKISSSRYLKLLTISFTEREKTEAFLNNYFEANNIKIIDVDYQSAQTGDSILYTHVYKLAIPDSNFISELVAALSDYPDISSLTTSDF